MDYGVSVVAHIIAWDQTNGVMKTGDAANITLKWNKDGVSSTTTNACSEVDATNEPGVYKVTLTAAECQCKLGKLSGKSTSSGIIIIGYEYEFIKFGTPAGADFATDIASIKTDTGTTILGRLPAALAASGGIKADLISILGTVLTETVGQIAAGVKKFFNIAAPAATMDHGILVDTATVATTASALTTNNDKTGYALTAGYDPAKTAAQAGDAMTLTAGERTTMAAKVWDALVAGIVTANSIGKRIIDFLTGDVYARVGAPAGASIAADIAAVYARDGAPAGASLAADIAAIKALLPAALVGGRIDASVGAMAADTVTSAALAASAGTEIAAAVFAKALAAKYGALTFEQAISVILSILASKTSGFAGASGTIRDIIDTTDVLVTSIDADGNRGVPTITP